MAAWPPSPRPGNSPRPGSSSSQLSPSPRPGKFIESHAVVHHGNRKEKMPSWDAHQKDWAAKASAQAALLTALEQLAAKVDDMQSQLAKIPEQSAFHVQEEQNKKFIDLQQQLSRLPEKLASQAHHPLHNQHHGSTESNMAESVRCTPGSVDMHGHAHGASSHPFLLGVSQEPHGTTSAHMHKSNSLDVVAHVSGGLSASPRVLGVSSAHPACAKPHTAPAAPVAVMKSQASWHDPCDVNPLSQTTFGRPKPKSKTNEVHYSVPSPISRHGAPPLPPFPVNGDGLPGSLSNEDEGPEGDEAAGSIHHPLRQGGLSDGDCAGGGPRRAPWRPPVDLADRPSPSIAHNTSETSVSDFMLADLQEERATLPTASALKRAESTTSAVTFSTDMRSCSNEYLRSSWGDMSSDGTESVAMIPSMTIQTQLEKVKKSSCIGGLSISPNDRGAAFLRQSRRGQSNLSKTLAYQSRASNSSMEQLKTCFENFGDFVDNQLEYLAGLLLLLNAVTTGWQTDVAARSPGETVPIHFVYLEACFCVAFVTEIVLRIIVHKSSFFYRAGWAWNVFDFVVVGFQIADFWASNLSGADMQTGNMRMLKTLRIVRVLRCLRMVRLIPSLKAMVYLIAASMMSFFWTLMLLLLLMYGVAVYFVDVGMPIRAANGDTGYADEFLEPWSTLPDALYACYQALLGGIDWKDLMLPFGEEGIAVFVFTLYIAFGSLVMLNLVTGVFVEGAQRIIREDKEVELKKTIRRLFLKNSEEGMEEHRDLTADKFSAKCETPEMDDFFQAVDLSRQEAKDIFHILDDTMHQTGILTSEDFVQGCLKLRGTARSVDIAALAYNQRNSAIQNLQFASYVEECMIKILSHLAPQGVHHRTDASKYSNDSFLLRRFNSGGTVTA